jgi:hypothetical protein
LSFKREDKPAACSSYKHPPANEHDNPNDSIDDSAFFNTAVSEWLAYRIVSSSFLNDNNGLVSAACAGTPRFQTAYTSVLEVTVTVSASMPEYDDEAVYPEV